MLKKFWTKLISAITGLPSVYTLESAVEAYKIASTANIEACKQAVATQIPIFAQSLDPDDPFRDIKIAERTNIIMHEHEMESERLYSEIIQKLNAF